MRPIYAVSLASVCILCILYNPMHSDTNKAAIKPINSLTPILKFIIFILIYYGMWKKNFSNYIEILQITHNNTTINYTVLFKTVPKDC